TVEILGTGAADGLDATEKGGRHVLELHATPIGSGFRQWLAGGVGRARRGSPGALRVARRRGGARGLEAAGPPRLPDVVVSGPQGRLLPGVLPVCHGTLPP